MITMDLITVLGRSVEWVRVSRARHSHRFRYHFIHAHEHIQRAELPYVSIKIDANFEAKRW